LLGERVRRSSADDRGLIAWSVRSTPAGDCLAVPRSPESVTTEKEDMISIARAVFRRFHLVTASVPLCGCERVPSVNVLGAFFPSWMLCILVGVALTLVGRRVLVAAGLEPWIGPRGLMYPVLALAFTLATWVTFFRG